MKKIFSEFWQKAKTLLEHVGGVTSRIVDERLPPFATSYQIASVIKGEVMSAEVYTQFEGYVENPVIVVLSNLSQDLLVNKITRRLSHDGFNFLSVNDDLYRAVNVNVDREVCFVADADKIKDLPYVVRVL